MWGMMTGPPTLKPNWFCFKAGVVTAKKLRASKAALRRNSHTAPWKRLVPDFVTRLTTEPPPQYSAEYEFVRILNSWIASGGGFRTLEVKYRSVSRPPSTMKMFAWVRRPLTLKPWSAAAPEPLLERLGDMGFTPRSEERRVGKECR